MSDTPFVRGAQRLGQRIRTISAKLAMPAMVDEIGELLLRRTKERFLREVDPDGKSWVPLRDTTLEIKRRLGYGDKQMLMRTEKMFNSIRLVRGSVEGAIFTNTGAGIRIGISNPEVAEYADYQNNGNGRIPARRFLGVGALDVKSVDSFLRRRAKQALDQS